MIKKDSFNRQEKVQTAKLEEIVKMAPNTYRPSQDPVERPDVSIQAGLVIDLRHNVTSVKYATDQVKQFFGDE